MAGYTIEERKKLKNSAPKLGLQALLGGKPAAFFATELLKLAAAGLKEESSYLAPLEELAADGLCPANVLLSQLKKAKTASEVKENILSACAI